MKSIDMSEEQIMMAVSQGELAQLSVLFENYKNRLYTFFLRMTRDGALSEDLIQNVFEKVIKYRSTYREEYPFRAWIYQIARNVHIDHHRKQKMKFSEHIDLANMPMYAERADRNLERDEMSMQIKEAISRLKPEFQEVILLTRFERMKYSEVAQIQGITEGAVKVRVHRAVKQFKEIYHKIARQ